MPVRKVEIVNGRKTETARFESVADMIKDAAEFYREKTPARIRPRDTEFLGRNFNDFEEIVQAAGGTWHEGLEIFEALRRETDAEITEKPRSIRRRHRFSEDDGDEVCLDRLRAGQPYWSTAERERVQAPKRVTVVTNIATSWDVEPQDIFWRGVAAMVLADRLEDAGYKTEILSASYCRRAYDNGEDYLGVCNIKSHFDPINRATLVNALSGWFYRSVFFTSKIQSTRPGYYCVRSNGRPIDITERLAAEVTGEPAVVISGIWSKTAAVRFVNETLKRINRGELIAAG